MPMRLTDPITATPRDGDPALVKHVIDFLEENYDTLYMDDVVPEYLGTMRDLCAANGLSFTFAVAQFCHETDFGRSEVWRDYRNPAGIAVEDDENRGLVYQSGTHAAFAHISHLCAYAYGKAHPLPLTFTQQDPKYRYVCGLPWAGTITQIGQLTGRWATDPNYGPKLVDRGNAIFPQLEDVPVVVAQEEKPVSGAVVLLTAGHRNTSGGDPAEAARTPTIARAYAQAFKNAGHTVWYLQDNPDSWYPGSLAGVAAEVVRASNRFGGDNQIALDIHIEGAGPNGPTGCFSIVPNGPGLIPAIEGDHANDSWDANVKDRAAAHAISAGISAQTGLAQRTCREKGVMDEHETGVGGDGYRLGMFGNTVAIKDRCVRLVVEHGNLQREASIIDRVDFAAKAAAGAVAGVEQVFGKAGGTKPPVPDPKPTIVYPAGFDYATMRRAFGTRVKGRGFSETGPVSRVWLAEKDYSPLMDHWQFDDGREYFYFASGLIIGRLANGEQFRRLL